MALCHQATHSPSLKPTHHAITESSRLHCLLSGPEYCCQSWPESLGPTEMLCQLQHGAVLCCAMHLHSSPASTRLCGGHKTSGTIGPSVP